MALTSVEIKTEEELRNALRDEKVNKVQLINDIEILDPSNIEVKGILKKLSGGNFKLIFNDNINPQITSNEFFEIEDLVINNNMNGVITLNKGGNLSNFISPRMKLSSTGEAHVLSSTLEGTSISNGNNSKIINSNIGTSGMYFYLSLNTIIDKVNINLGDSYNYGIMLSSNTSADISNTTITGGAYGIYSSTNGWTTNITNTQISGSKYNGIYNSGAVNGSPLTLSDVDISDTGSYGIYNKGDNSQGSITVASGGNLILNTGNNIGIYQENGYLNIMGDVIHNGNQYTLLNSSNSGLNDPDGIMKLVHQNGSILLYNSIHRYGDDVALTSVEIKTEEELRNALRDEKVNKVQLINDIEILDPSNIEVKGILKKLSGGNFKLIFNDNINPQITSNEFFEIEDLVINNNMNGVITLNKGGNLSNFISPRMKLSSTGEAHVLSSTLEGTSISNGNNSKIINSNIGTSGMYFYLSLNTIIDKVNINLGDSYNYGIMLSSNTSADISNTTITGGAYGIYSSTNGWTTNITNTQISGSKYNGIYNSGAVNGSPLTLSDVDISDTGGYGIYNKGDYSQGSITVASGGTLSLNTGNNIGIFQENGSFNLYGHIRSESSGILISSDLKSQTNDYNNQLICLNPGTDSNKNYVLKENNVVKTIILTTANDETRVVLNKNLQIIASVGPTNAIDKSVTWSVENGTGSASISPTGLLTGLSAGTVFVKATANDGSGVSASITINVVIPVNFNSQGGSEVTGIIAQSGSLIAAPEAPTKVGYTFEGWYKEAECTNKWDFATDRVTNATTLFAKWVINTYTVSFISQDGTSVLSISANYNSLIQVPPSPTKLGYTFAGWYIEDECINAWDFGSNKVTSNTLLYEKWIENPSTPSIISGNSTSYNSVELNWGAVTGAEGYEIYRATSFTGVYSLISRTTAINFNDTGLTTGNSYYYKVRAYKISGNTKVYSGYSLEVNVKPIPSVPLNLKTVSISPTSIKLTWNEVGGANGYEIYRSTTSAGTYSLVTDTKLLTYTDTGLVTGKTYFYKIRSYRMVGFVKVYSNWTSVVYKKT